MNDPLASIIKMNSNLEKKLNTAELFPRLLMCNLFVMLPFVGYILKSKQMVPRDFCFNIVLRICLLTEYSKSTLLENIYLRIFYFNQDGLVTVVDLAMLFSDLGEL